MPAEVILMFDVAGVLTTSPYPAARRLAETLMRCVFDRAEAHMILYKAGNRSANFSTALLAQNYSSLYSVIRAFTTNIRRQKSAFERLELGEINRVEFPPMFYEEMDFMLKALSKKNVEELEALNITNVQRLTAIKERYPLLAEPVVQELLRELFDADAYLSTMEKVSPRKNVLNLLHYLRMRSQQEIRFVVVANAWEVEGQYQHMLKTMSQSAEADKWTYFPSYCPVEYGPGKGKGSFSIDGLFDAYLQSYMYHKRKPFPDLIQLGLDEAMKIRVVSKASLKYNVQPHIFYFDDVLRNCETATNLTDNPFEKVYYIENGAYDVFEDVLNALKIVGSKDPFWADVAAGVEKDMSPLFRPPVDDKGKPTSWINEEMYDYNHNLLHLPPPPCHTSEKRSIYDTTPFLDDDEKDAIIFYCAEHLPHLFPMDIPKLYSGNMQLARRPSLATSAGPIIFEHMKSDGFQRTYRITLRTGSYMLRVQPSGPAPYGTLDIRTEYEVMRYLRKHTSLPIATCLLYCESYAVCGRRFSLRRSVDGEVITTLNQLIQPRIQRPYSKCRQMVNVELDPRRFFKEAVNVLAKIHDAPIPKIVVRSTASKASKSTHPLLNGINEWFIQYKAVAAMCKSGMRDKTSILHSSSLERLAHELQELFGNARLGEQRVPVPERLVLLHGDYNLRDVVFSHRSLEGRHKYPPKVLAVMNFKSAVAGDPLIDVARLAFFSVLPPPDGIFGVQKGIREYFPTAIDVFEQYCTSRGYMQQLSRRRRKEIFTVYLAATCLWHAVMATSRVAEVIRSLGDTPQAFSRSMWVVEHAVQQGLALLGKTTSRL